MQPEPQPVLPPEIPAAAPPEKKLLAPIWHTVLVIILIVIASYFSSPAATPQPVTDHALTQKALLIQYAAAVALEFIMLALIWFGIRLKGVKLRELIGGRWKTPEDFLIDIGIAIGFWIIALFVLAGLGYAMGLASPSQAKEAKKIADMLAPQGWSTILIWIGVSTIAGFVEEIVFRGYLQRQLGLITGNVYVGLVISAILFGGAHGYEGGRRMVLIAVYGVMFGLLVLWRKSLRPGMIAHAWHDSFEGILLYIMSRKGVFSMM